MRVFLAAMSLGLLVVSSVGCSYITVERGQQGKAWVVKSTPFGSTMWNCDASDGEPKCHKVSKK
ncbi:MAG: hypothetical protein V1754_16070 [Pseudomonadota bacterium]